jgi:predicted dinucleotide-binding enzyme
MKIAVLGTGSAGRALAAGMAGAGHEVCMGTRDVQATIDRDDVDQFGVSLSQWMSDNPAVGIAVFSDCAAAGDLVINATNGQASLLALEAAGSENLAGKVLIDTANPLDFSQGFPPTLFVRDTDSLGERIQRAFPQSRVVKSLNTLNAGLMLNPSSLGAPSAVFVSGDDPGAKQQVVDLLTGFGWEHVLDLGGISTARGVEMLMPMWLQLMGMFGDASFNWAIVR